MPQPRPEHDGLKLIDEKPLGNASHILAQVGDVFVSIIGPKLAAARCFDAAAAGIKGSVRIAANMTQKPYNATDSREESQERR